MQTKTESVEEQRKKAVQFLGSSRGNYIVGRCLYETYQRIKNEEPSDASDMEYLGHNLFTLGWISAHAMVELSKRKLKKSKLGRRK